MSYQSETHLEVELPATSHRSVLKSLDDTHVRILHRGVLADEDNVNRLVHPVVSVIS